MEKIRSILVVADRSNAAPGLLAKSVGLARKFGAGIELFLCDSEHAYALAHAYDSSGVEQARRTCLAEVRQYLEALKDSADAQDVAISIDVDCESPLYQGIVQKVLRSRPDLVIKNAAGEASQRRLNLDANDWQLMRTCPVTLMLSRGKRWRSQPQFAAAVDVSEQESAGLVRKILHAAEYLTMSCDGELDVLYSERSEAGAEQRLARTDALRNLAHEFRIGAHRVHLLVGQPEQTLPAFAGRHVYDVLVLGALTHRKGPTELVGSLTSRLVDVLDCDFVLVKPDTYRSPVEAKVGEHEGSQPRNARASQQASISRSSRALWQLMFGD